jgi:hypothetical protein
VYQATTATKATGLNQWNYSGKSISISAQEAGVSGLFFRDDGTRMFVVGSNSDTVFQYNLGTAWDVTTATYTTGNALSIAAQDTAAGDIYFKPDGLAFYLLGDTNNSVFQYTISTPWTINTGAYASKSFSVAAQETSPSGLWFRPDGSTMYVLGSASDSVHQYSLGTAWDVTTATFVRSFSVAAEDTVPASLVFNPTGTSFYITGTSGDNVYQYNLSTAWDISTSVFVPNPFHVGFQENTPTGLFIDFAADNRAYVAGSSTDLVNQYNTATTSVSFASDRFNYNGNFNITGATYFDGVGDFGSSVTVYGTSSLSTTSINATLTASSTISLSGATTSTTTLGNAATTGTTTIGGTAQTGAITFGQSTAAQTANIATGATATATTKTVNIGTAGLSGSTTNINIGSAVSGAAGTITFSSGGTQLAVTNTASAVNFVQVTGAATAAAPAISFQGSDSNISGSLVSKGSGTLRFLTNTTIEQLRVLHTGSAVNYLTATGSATGFAVPLSVAGSDTNIDLTLTPKGTGTVVANGPFAANSTAQFGRSSANYIQTVGGATTVAPILSSQGSDTDVSLTLQTQGSGNLLLNSATGGGMASFAATSSTAAHYWSFQQSNSSTGTARLGVTGTGTNGSIAIVAKGSGSLQFSTANTTGNLQLAVANTASAVNYVQVTGAATGASPTISVQGSDANANITLQSKGTGNAVLMDGGGNTGLRLLRAATSGDTFVDVQRLVGGVSFAAASSVTNGAMVFQSKGTGAIDLAAGSSGVNISNGGTVTAITQTNSGSGYTSLPTPAISAPTTAGGVQATISITMSHLSASTISNGGTGYAVNDVLTIVGGTTGTAATFTVTTVSGGVVTGITRLNTSTYTVLPSSPAATTVSPAGGTGCTIAVNWAVNSTFTITAAGSGYVEQPTVTFSGGGGSGATAYATVGADTVFRSLSQNLDVFSPAGRAFRVWDSQAGTNATYWSVRGATSGAPAVMTAQGETNTNGTITSTGTGYVRFMTNTNNVEQLRVSHTASAVNYVQVTGAATGNAPIVSAQGSDTNVGFRTYSKGIGSISFWTASGSSRQFQVSHASGTVVNYATATGSIAGASPAFSVDGTDTDIDLTLTPKGTGNVRFGTYTGTILTPTGFIEIRDAGGTIRRLLVG